MDLKELIEFKGIKLLDSNVFDGLPLGRGLIDMVYECMVPGQLPKEAIMEELNTIRERTGYLARRDIFSVREVGQEIGNSIEKINESLRFYQDPKSFSGRSRRRNRIVEEVKSLRRKNDYKERNEKYNLLSGYAKALLSLRKKIEKNDVRNSFSQEEKELYQRFFSYFSFISEIPGVKRDFSSKYGRSRNHLNLQTDEKLLAAAMTLACSRRDRIMLISSDSDLKRMKSFFYLDQDARSKLPEPNYRVPLYSDFGKGFKVQEKDTRVLSLQ